MKILAHATILAAFLATAISAIPARADLPVVEDARATQTAQGWRFDVTVRHPDTGWDHYADAWEILAPDGTSLGLRELLHPHETEQPFTRSLGGVEIADGIDRVMIRARDTVHGWAQEMFVLDLPR